MKTLNTKKKTGKPKTLQATKKTPGKSPAPGASAKKKGKPAGKTSTKSLGKEKKSSALKKTSKKPLKAQKKLSAGSSRAAKKTSAKKSLKPAQVKAKKVKKKITQPKPIRKKTEQKAVKGALAKAPSFSKEISPLTRKEVIEKTKEAETPGTIKTEGYGIIPSPAKKPGKGTKPETGAEERRAPLPKSKEVFEHVSPIELPGEYGENELILIAVDPNMVFVDWEIRIEEARRAGDGFTMRIFNAPGGESLRSPKESYVDIKIKDRVGRAFFELGMPGRKVAIEIGMYENGKFLPVLRSPAISMPRLLTIDELGIAQKLFESGIPVGY